MRREIDADRLLNMLHQAIVPPTRPNPLVVAWRWRYEMTLLVGLPLTLVGLVHVLTPDLAMLVVTTMAILVARWPAARRRLVARGWCILTPHRLRAGCVQARIHTRRGRLPTILWCAPKAYGEQVLIWCPAGVTAQDFVAARQVLASTCYASDIEVVADPKYRHLVMLAVTRYQALSVVPGSSDQPS